MTKYELRQKAQFLAELTAEISSGRSVWFIPQDDWYRWRDAAQRLQEEGIIEIENEDGEEVAITMAEVES